MSSSGYPFQRTPQTASSGCKGERGKCGLDGSKGSQGIKGDPGHHGVSTIIRFAIENVLPKYLPKNGIISPHFDGENVPIEQIRLNIGESVIYKPDGTLWTYLPKSGFLGWVNTGTFSNNIINIPGEIGEEGVKGDTGPQGPKGEAGFDGFDGRPGRHGVDGLKGEIGPIGPAGRIGVQGNKGDTGARGLDGINGINGEKGLKGEVGDLGLKGDDGKAGLRGFVGSKGEKGDDADSLRLGITPKAAIFYDGYLDRIRDKHNISAVKKLNTGAYRVRFERKLSRDEYVVMVQATSNNKGVSTLRQAIVTQRTKSYCLVEVTNPITNTPEDAVIDVLVYQFIG